MCKLDHHHFANSLSFTVCIALTILKTEQELVVERKILTRDLIYYIFSTVVVLAFGLYGEITWWQSVLMLVIYVALVVHVTI